MNLLIRILSIDNNIFNNDYFVKVTIVLLREFIYSSKDKTYFRKTLFSLISENLIQQETLYPLKNVLLSRLMEVTNPHSTEEMKKLIDFLAQGYDAISEENKNSSLAFGKRMSGVIEYNNDALFKELEKLLPSNFYEEITKVKFYLFII